MTNRISIVGLGRLGLPLAACFAYRGFNVVGVDINQEVIESARQCKPRAYEPHLEWLLQRTKHKLSLTTDIATAVRVTPATIVIVGTPSDKDGCFSLEYVLSAAKGIGQALRNKDEYHLVIVSSTVNPRDCETKIWTALESSSGKEIGKDIGLCYVPEFVALGEIVRGFLKPDSILMGVSDRLAHARCREIYKRFLSNIPDDMRTLPPFVRTNLTNAETAKLAANCLTVVKTVFANQVAELCESISGADVDEVMGAVGMDSRFSPEYLKGSTAALGPCFGRDMKSLPCVARHYGVELPLIETADALNNWQVDRLINMMSRAWYHVPNATVGILGLAYKPGVDVKEPSTGLLLLEKLKKTTKVIAYDPMILVEQSVASAQDLVDTADIVIVTLPYKEFKELEFKLIPQVVIDCWRVLDSERVKAPGRKYVAIGRFIE
jgi:UDPglucose 6-dehydrogenase